MNIRAYKFIGGIIPISCLAGLPQLHAQSSFALPFSLTQSSPATSFKIDPYGAFSEGGPLSSSATFSFANTSQTSQMVWLPALAAFRAGTFSGSQTTIGQYSVALGCYANASGQYSVALGYNSNASGQGSTVFSGCVTTASGQYSIAGGPYAYATGNYAIALGNDAGATGKNSFSAGADNCAIGANSTALGGFTEATGNYATSLNGNTLASGNYSVAMGSVTNSNSFVSVVAGQYNIGLSSTGATPNATSWVATDPLVEIGNGTSSSAKSDAMILYKNGNMAVQGVVTVAAGGDIPMYTGH